jgi:xanthine dehydrogenase YagR molybdenum-binding subunit
MSKTSLGANVERVDGRDKVMGKAIYGADRILPRMAHALPVTATVGKGRITAIDLVAANAVKGVLAILDYRTLGHLQPVVFSFAGGHAIQSLQPLQTPDVAYRGQAVALVVATTIEAAYEAAALVDIKYISEPFVVDLNAEGRQEVMQAVATPYFPDFIHGDAEASVAAAPFILDEIYRTSPQHQNPIELLSVVAEWEGDRLTIHEGSQASQAIQGGLAVQLGIAAANIRVISPYVGGGFGQRGALSPHTLLAAVAARKVGRPVKLTVPRSQVFHATSFRGANEHHIRIGADRSGRLTGGLHLVRAQTSRFDLMPYTGEETTSRMYAWPAFRGATTLVKLDTQTPGFMRAPMEMGSFFALESAMDELAIKLELDPVALRIMNDAIVDPITGKPFSSRRLRSCLERGAARFGWDKRSAAPGSMRDGDGTLVGWGVAAGAYPGYIGPALAKVRLQRGGKVTLSVGGHEMGQGLRTAIAIVAASELGVDLEKIEIRIGDTAFPPQHTTAGAWGAATATMPVREASRAIRQELIRLATKDKDGPFQGDDPATLAMVDGWLVGPHGRQRVDDILRAARIPGLDGEGRGKVAGLKPDALKQAAIGKISTAGPEFPEHVSFSFVAHFAEVRIDPRIPRPKVTRFVSVIDCGRVISRRTAESQAYGGIVWGIGSALFEGSEVDPRFGGFLNNNIAEYQIAVNADVRQCEIEFIDEDDPIFNGLGAKGLGEVVCVGAAAAIANAVHHATGRRIRHLPIRMEDLVI